MCRYTSAAPTYFYELDNYVDGGIIANNPGASGLTEIQTAFHKMGRKLPISLIASISAGQYPEKLLGRTDPSKLLFSKQFILKSLFSRLSNLVSLLSTAVRIACIEVHISHSSHP